MVEIDDHEFVLADIPGLIEGASEGKGIGTRFLGHIERCEVLLHLIDCADEDPVGTYRTVREELEGYADILIDKPEVVALSKADQLLPEMVEEQREILEKGSERKSLSCPVPPSRGSRKSIANCVATSSVNANAARWRAAKTRASNREPCRCKTPDHQGWIGPSGR